MQRLNQVSLPSESRNNTGVIRRNQPMHKQAPHPQQAQSLVATILAQQSAQPPAAPQHEVKDKKDAGIINEMIEKEYYAGNESVNMTDYFLGTLNQFKDDSAVMNPMNVELSATSEGIATTNAGSVIAQLSTGPKASLVDIAMPIGHSAIDDTRVYYDTSILTQAYGGYANGEIPMQFVDLNGITPPDRIVKITLAPFNFPHIYTTGTTVFDLFYFRTIFMTIRFVPTTHLFQSAAPNDLFTFELNVDDIDSQAVYLVPKEPTFCLKQPVNVTGDLAVKFQTKNPIGTGFTPCPIPPTRIRVRRTIAALGITTFQIVSANIYIGALAPPAAIYTVPVIFQRFTVAPVPLTALETVVLGNALIPGQWQTSNFLIGGTFTIPCDTVAVPFGTDDMFIYVPKNTIGISMRFSSLQSTKTNDLFPIHN